MTKKKIVLLDLDNTLIDFNECARHSIINSFKKHGFTYSDDVFKTFITENVKIWKRLERGEITKADLRADRWNIILGKLGIDYDGTIIEEEFENGVAQGAYAVEGAYELLDYLYPKYELYIVSNGFRFVQESRLKIGDFRKYFKDIFLSEDIGVQKPAKEFFDYCFKKLEIPPKEDVILIGDSLSADIIGGLNYGIDCIWFNKNGDELSENIKPTYIVNKLKDIEKIL
ncbi:MAG: YjjG family noncanonical pyrimidine nucleotidase [Acutalibacteraceae bacterium]|nr:YjjG family noncanonical pyrimidine nucleotidase [Acutalibacteraceae bacterium]